MREDAPLVVATIGHRFPDAFVEEEALKDSGIKVRYLGGLPKSEALAGAAEDDAVLLGASFSLQAPDIARLKNCRAIIRYGVGVDNIDVRAAASQEIIVCNVPDYATSEVADHTLALLLALARNLDVWATAARDGRWGNSLPRVSMPRLKDTTLGVIGAGRIGRAVINRAHPIWGSILVHDPYLSAEQLTALKVAAAPLDILLANSDFVTLHVPSSSATRGLLSAERLRSMKRGAMLVNCSRGDLIDETALAACLADGHIRRAGLDVFVDEPPHLNGLISDTAVWPTPHVAWLSTAALRELRRRAAQEAGRILTGQAPRFPLTS